ncbi:PLP-dependent transferase [Penicillium longicatenatum]|nr:PLP-dependent transferase [Penicillium longicatenatum]
MDPSSGLSTHAGATVAQLLPAFDFSKFDIPRNESGTSPIDMSMGENGVLGDEMISACKSAVEHDFAVGNLSYPKSPLGDPELLKILAIFFNNYFQPAQRVESSHISVAAGASACLNDLMYSICEPGDAVLVPGPYWSECFMTEYKEEKETLLLILADGFDFHFSIRAQVTPITVSLPQMEDQFTLELISALENAYKSASRPVRAIVLTNPHNPLGRCYPKEVLEGCLVFCARHNLHFISDEVYALSTFSSDDFSQTPVPFTPIMSLNVTAIGGDLSRVHTVWSISKDFGCNGLRIGCIVSQENQPLNLHLGISASLNFSSVSSLIAKAILTSPQLPHLLALSSQRLGKQYKVLTAFLKSRGIEYFPASAGLFVFARLVPDAKTWEEEADMVRRMRDVGVLVGPGKVYHTGEGDKGWFRLTFALKNDILEQGLQRLERGLINF